MQKQKSGIKIKFDLRYEYTFSFSFLGKLLINKLHIVSLLNPLVFKKCKFLLSFVAFLG